jgi:hypothetical protein
MSLRLAAVSDTANGTPLPQVIRASNGADVDRPGHLESPLSRLARLEIVVSELEGTAERVTHRKAN